MATLAMHWCTWRKTKSANNVKKTNKKMHMVDVSINNCKKMKNFQN